jgi:chemotaxis protein CheX
MVTEQPPAQPANATAAGAAARPSVGSTLVVPFINSVRQVLSTMAGVQATIGRPHLKGSPAPTYDVSSIIGFSGEVTGAVVVSFQREAAVRIVSAFAGTEISADSPDFADAVGELANMIAGSAKKDLDSVASITVPSVIIGHGHTIAGLSDVPTVVSPCTTPVGSLAVEVSIKQSKARA